MLQREGEQLEVEGSMLEIVRPVLELLWVSWALGRDSNNSFLSPDTCVIQVLSLVDFLVKSGGGKVFGDLVCLGKKLDRVVLLIVKPPYASPPLVNSNYFRFTTLHRHKLKY